MPNAFAHVELNTDDLKKITKFYQKLFAWKLSPAPGPMPYTMIDVGGGTGGGMQVKQSPDMPSAWLPYVEVDDVKKVLAAATKAGGSVCLDYREIGEMGAIGILIDPSGAQLGVWAPRSVSVAPAVTAKKPAEKTSAPKAAAKASAPKASAPKASAPKASAPKASAPKASAPKASAPKATEKATAAKASASKAAAPKPAAPKVSAPKAAAPKNAPKSPAKPEPAKKAGGKAAKKG